MSDRNPLAARAHFVIPEGCTYFDCAYKGLTPRAAAAAAALSPTVMFEEEGLVERARRVGETIRARMLAWQERFEAIGDVRGLGAMLAVEYVEDRGTKEPAPGIASRVAEEAAARGLLLLKAGVHSNCNRVLCPLVITDAELEEGLGAWEEALEAVLA